MMERFDERYDSQSIASFLVVQMLVMISTQGNLVLLVPHRAQNGLTLVETWKDALYAWSENGQTWSHVL